ncbi:MAG: hypothetical protein ACJA07_001537 [Rhodococcus sp. (in: high G+C Gram-positive bacteria)]
MKEFDAAIIEELLGELDTKLQQRGVEAKIFVVGGAAMALAYNATRITEDIDGIFVPRDVVVDAAREVARERGLDEFWLSDGVVQMMPPNSDDNPRSRKVGAALTLEIASPEYILAMKAMSTRHSRGDLDDAANLCGQLGIAAQADLERVVQQYFGPQQHYGAQELFFERIIEAANGIPRL